MPAGSYSFTVEQGTTLQKTIVWKDNASTPINITGYTARMQIRSTITSINPLVVMTTENFGITLGGVLGTIVLFQTSDQTAAYSWTTGVYDLELASGAATPVVTRLLKGTITVDPEVTR